jgi:hypothetical protein
MFGRIRLDSAVRALAYLDRTKSEDPPLPAKSKSSEPNPTVPRKTLKRTS